MKNANNINTPLQNDQLIARVQQLLEQYCDKKIEAAATIGEQYQELWTDTKKCILNGGKRIRPLITAVSYFGYGGEDLDEILPVACAWEVLHSALLIHDDIIDRDDIRHNYPNISGMYKEKYSPILGAEVDHYALSAALLSGDLLLVAAFEFISTSHLSDKKKNVMQTLLQKAFFEVGGGQHQDVQSVLQPIERVDTREVIRYKTSGYSFVLPMQSGALMAGAGSAELQQLQQVGELLGNIFQLGDDLLGVFGDSSKTGKPTDSDIREKKRTYLVQRALNDLSELDAKRINELFLVRHDLTESEIREVFETISQTSAREEVRDMIDDQAKRAKQVIDTLHASKEMKEYLFSLLDLLSKRSS